MRFKSLLIVNLVMLVCFFVICFSNHAYLQQVAPTTPSLGPDNQSQILAGDTSQTIQVEANKEFPIDIKCNLTTGYDMVVTYFPAAVQLVKFTRDASREKGMVGAPATCHYTFKLLQPVGTKIFFTNVRPTTYEMGETIEYQVNVK